MSAAKVPIAGWREDDARAIHRLHNFAAASIADANLSPRVIRRRMLLLSAWLKATAESVYGPVEPEALESVADFWRRRAGGER
jgi:hypothetical protein